MLDRKIGTSNGPLLEVRRLKKYFPVKKGVFSRVSGWIKAVDDVSFAINEGETFGLVGESGCGKSTTAKLILLIESVTSGSIWFEGKSRAQFSDDELQAYRESIQAVFQDPTGSLSPRLRVGSIISEPMTVRSRPSKAEINVRIAEVLKSVGMRPGHARLFPHEFSGGQRQRIAIARALSTRPKLIILDEPISSLDVSIRAQVMNLLLRLQGELGFAFLLIAHDLAVVLHMSSRVGVMYVGRIVESADGTELYQHPTHPYTKALFTAAFYHLTDSSPEATILPGEVASPLNPPPGCRFHPRCPYVMPICREIEPDFKDIASGHKVACHLMDR
jgi:peptide/nickel transport system ATP-binding protein/oligopeptide transport system ATP-binding protein